MLVKLTLALVCSVGLCPGLEESFTDSLFPPSDWVTVNADSGAREWQRLDIGYRTGPGCAHCGRENVRLRNNDWLIAPRCSVAQGDSFGFWYRAWGPDCRESLEVWVSEGTPRLPEFTQLDAFGADSVAYRRRRYDITPYAGRRLFFALVYRSLNRTGVMVDDVFGPQGWHPEHDVGVDSVLLPRAIRVGKSATPACIVCNWTGVAEAFRVAYEIPGMWREETTVTLGAHESLLVGFPLFRFSQPGTLDVVFSTHLATDQRPWNDTAKSDVAVHSYQSRGGPDSTGYVWYDSDDPLGPEYDWLELCPEGTQLGWGDDTFFCHPLEWSVQFYGKEYSMVFVSTNGWLAFGPPTPGRSSPENVGMPATTAPNQLAAVFWDDLWVEDNEGGLWYRYFGDSLLVVEWKSARRKGRDRCSLDFEAKVFRNGVIEYHYRGVDAGDLRYDKGASASVGIENSSGRVGLEYLCDGVPPANLLEPDRAIRFVPPAPGVSERHKPVAPGPMPEPTVVGDVLVWSATTPSLRNVGDIALQSRAKLLDAAGRIVMELRPGPNDIRHIAPGVYFVRRTGGSTRSAVRKVVIQR